MQHAGEACCGSSRGCIRTRYTTAPVPQARGGHKVVKHRGLQLLACAPVAALHHGAQLLQRAQAQVPAGGVSGEGPPQVFAQHAAWCACAVRRRRHRCVGWSTVAGAAPAGRCTHCMRPASGSPVREAATQVGGGVSARVQAALIAAAVVAVAAAAAGACPPARPPGRHAPRLASFYGCQTPLWRGFFGCGRLRSPRLS